MNPQKRKQIHDHFFRELMSRIAIAKGILVTFINPLILKTIVFSTFEIVKDDWISEKLKESRSDILYRARLRNQSNWIYFLFEHKSGSSSDKYTPFQIHYYMSLVWDEFKKQDTTSEKMPVILPVIVYHGKKPWNISNSIKPLFAISKETEKYVPDFESEIIDLSVLNDEELGDQVELRAFLMALKYSRKPEILNVLPGIIRLFNSLRKSNDDYLKEVLLYIGSLVGKSNVKEFLEIIEREHIGGVSYMQTIAEALSAEERKKSQKLRKEIRQKETVIRQKEMALREEKKKENTLHNVIQKKSITHKEMQKEVALLRKEAQENKRKIDFTVKQLLKKKMRIEFIHETTGLSRKRIEEIKKNME
jgi:predicted transposase/invertase (TIGR01784 family)